MRKLLLILAAAALCVVACKKDEDGSSANGNYWAMHNTVAKGIKTIVEDNYTSNYDKDGRLVSQKTQYDETTYTYNSEGFPTKIVSKSFDDKGAVLGESTETYEYGNKGKYTPVPMGPGHVFHLFMNGLYNGISKVTFSDGTGNAVMVYKFSGNKLTITTTDDQKSEYEDIVYEYDGAYPVHYKRAPVGNREFGEEIGPNTYMANGMFDTYRENFLTDGIVYSERTYTVDNSFKTVLLPAKVVMKDYNLNYNDKGTAISQAECYNTMTTTYIYNEHGDCVTETTVNTGENSEDSRYTYEYEYDSKGNWTKCTATSTVIRPANAREPFTYTRNRTIQYY